MRSRHHCGRTNDTDRLLVNTNAHSDFGGSFPLPVPISGRSLTAYEHKVLQNYVSQGYETFLSRVMAGRGMEHDELDAIAQGRVWSGSDALEIGLVDSIGTLKDALVYAAGAAGNPDLASWQIAEYPKPLTTFEMILESLGGSASVFAGTPLENVEKAFSSWKADESGKVYARMPYEITLE